MDFAHLLFVTLITFITLVTLITLVNVQLTYKRFGFRATLVATRTIRLIPVFLRTASHVGM